MNDRNDAAAVATACLAKMASATFATGADEPACLLGAAYHLWRGGSEQIATLVALLRNAIRCEDCLARALV